MRVVVTGATGNVGTSVLAALAAEPKVTEIVGLARRQPEVERPKVSWVRADVTDSALEPIFDGADAVVHLACAGPPAASRPRPTRATRRGSSVCSTTSPRAAGCASSASVPG
jgi:nucleoside-diphosphate-sugar epimerase